VDRAEGVSPGRVCSLECKPLVEALENEPEVLVEVHALVQQAVLAFARMRRELGGDVEVYASERDRVLPLLATKVELDVLDNLASGQGSAGFEGRRSIFPRHHRSRFFLREAAKGKSVLNPDVDNTNVLIEGHAPAVSLRGKPKPDKEFNGEVRQCRVAFIGME
jgi:hypothetical protein